MRNAQYWQKRFDLLQASLLNKGIEYYNNLSVQYDKAALSVQREIEAFYQRFADNNQMDLFEARKLLNTRQLKEFRWSVEEYIEKGKTLNYTNQWAKELENASTRHRVTRLQAMQLQMQQQVESLMGNEVDGLDNVISDIYEDGYYRTIFEVQKGVGVGESFATLDTDKISKVISKPWATDGTNFSERVWGEHRASLVQSLNSDFTQAIIRGDAPDKLIKKIADDFGVAKYKAKRLVLTESSFFSSESHKDAYKELGVEEVKILATLDIGTCSDCGERDGEKIPMSMYETGVTVPPFHPNCKCTTAPVDDFDDGIESYRAARDENGKYYEVPDSMTYKQWKEKYVDGDLTKSKNKSIIKTEDVSKLEQAKKRDKKIYINDIAISKVPLIHIKGLTEEQSEIFQQKHKDLLHMAMTKNNSNEVANVFSLDFAHNIFHFGNENMVSLSKHPTIVGLIRGSDEKTVFVAHNHPSTKKFSYTDFSVILMNESVFGISAITNTGEAHILVKTEDYDRESAFILLTQIRDKYLEKSNGIYDEQMDSNVVKEFLKICGNVGLIYQKGGGGHEK